MKSGFSFERRSERYQFKHARSRRFSFADRGAGKKKKRVRETARFVFVSGFGLKTRLGMGALGVGLASGRTLALGRNAAKRAKVGANGKANYHH